jgi:hypothetical protein
LNYRIDLPDAQVRALLAGAQDARVVPPVRAENFALLRRHDQLAGAIRHARAFDGFGEGAMGYLPYVLVALSSGVRGRRR